MAECYEVLADHIREGISQGRFRTMDPLLAARSFLGMVVYHSWVQELFGGKRYQEFSVQEVSRNLADVWLQGASVRREGNGSQAATKPGRNNKRNHRGKQ
jgi:TetR/AcrR family transcriptional regulator